MGYTTHRVLVYDKTNTTFLKKIDCEDEDMFLAQWNFFEEYYSDYYCLRGAIRVAFKKWEDFSPRMIKVAAVLEQARKDSPSGFEEDYDAYRAVKDAFYQNIQTRYDSYSPEERAEFVSLLERLGIEEDPHIKAIIR